MVVWFQRFGGEEFKDCSHPTGYLDRHTKCGTDSDVGRDLVPWEVSVFLDVGDPDRLAQAQHAAGQTDAGSEPSSRGDVPKFDKPIRIIQVPGVGRCEVTGSVRRINVYMANRPAGILAYGSQALLHCRFGRVLACRD